MSAAEGGAMLRWPMLFPARIRRSYRIVPPAGVNLSVVYLLPAEEVVSRAATKPAGKQNGVGARQASATDAANKRARHLLPSPNQLQITSPPLPPRQDIADNTTDHGDNDSTASLKLRCYLDRLLRDDANACHILRCERVYCARLNFRLRRMFL